jgi:hypothetical protein
MKAAGQKPEDCSFPSNPEHPEPIWHFLPGDLAEIKKYCKSMDYVFLTPTEAKEYSENIDILRNYLNKQLDVLELKR